MLGREGVTGIDRVCNLGVVQGGWTRYLRVLYLVPENECSQRKGRQRRQDG